MKIDYPSPSQIPDLRVLWKEAFSDTDTFLDSFFSTAYTPLRCRCVTEDGALAAALYWFDCECDGRKLAYLYAVATAGAFRSRGLCTALMADTHGLLKSRGYSGALLVPGSQKLASFYSKMGYCYATQIREYSCTAKGPAISLHTVDASEYAALRRNLLPPGSVHQEDALPFLVTQAQLLAGDGLLLAAQKDKDSLFALELLGDASAAPGILYTLGVSRGQFRTPGKGRDYAMYLPLDNFPAPQYFGFAFD